MISRKESLIIAIGGGGCNVAATVKAQGLSFSIRNPLWQRYGHNDLKTKYPDMNLLDAFSKVDAQVAEVLQNMLV